MPFPLAHPAAVLPLRRYCPRYLNFPALMIGSLTPDVGYCLQRFRVDQFSHSFVGSVAFCLPTGIAMLLVFCAIRESLAAALPAPHRDALLPLCRKPNDRPVWAIVLSLLIGAWTHICLDRLTRESNWLLYQLPGIQNEIAAIERKHIRVYRLLWYGLSFAGLAWLTLTYLQFLKCSTGSRRIFSAREKKRFLLWASVIVVPYVTVVPLTVTFPRDMPASRAVSSFLLDSMQVYLVAVAALVMVIGFGVKARRSRNGQTGTGRKA
jgi:hypothetical protein